jgi:hypothetical protein
MSSKVKAASWLFVGGALWLDFINTEIVEHGHARNLLQNMADYHTWLKHALTRTSRSEMIVVQRRRQKADQ